MTVTGAAVTLGGIAQAGNPPLGPGNIEIFPKRDMVALEGYADQAGETATVTVSRNGQQIGIGEGVVDATGFLEFNHPGGSCWTGVTPNISGGDLVEVRFSETAFTDGAYVSTAKITDVTHNTFAETPDEGDVEGTVTIAGTYGGDVDLNRFNVEVVNPEMRRPDPATPPTLIGERAIGWSPVEDPAEPNGGPGFAVEGTMADGAFSVTFSMFSAADAERVLDGEHVVTTWMADGAGGEEVQLGTSLYEFGETDGPGFGGCPAGPASQAPVPPTDVDAVRDGGTIDLAWTTPAQPVDANAITQYRVAAVDGVTGQEIAVRQGANTTGENSARIQGLDAEQSYRLILEANNGHWSPVVELGTIDAAGTITPATDPTNPDTTGGGTGGGTGGDGGTGETPEEPAAAAPTAPSLTRVLVGHESVTAEWTAAQPGNATSPVTGYEIVAVPAAVGATPVTLQVAATATSGTVTGLVNGVDHTIQVFALAGDLRTGSTTAAGVAGTVRPTDVITISRAQYRADKREYRIQGTAGDTTANRVHLRIGDVAGSGGVIQLNVPVAADGTWSVDLRNGPNMPTTNRFNVTSDSGASTVAAMTRSR